MLTIGSWLDPQANGGTNPPAAGKYTLYPTLTDASKAWTSDKYAGRVVTMGGLDASIYTNIATVLILDRNAAWYTPVDGVHANTPAAGTYAVLNGYGVVEIERNTIDCTNDGHGLGGYGVFLYASRAGTRARVSRNTVRNANADAIHVKFTDGARPFVLLEITDNVAIDDQVTPTCTSVVRIEAPQNLTKLLLHLTKLLLRGNTGEGVDSLVTGLSSGVWLVTDGDAPVWAGYDSPESVVPATVGATYQRLNGGTSTTLYIKETGTENVGWIALGGTGGSTTPIWVSDLALVGGNYDPSCLGSASVTCANGVMQLWKAKVYTPTITKVLVQVTVAHVTATNVWVTIYKSDGTQTAEMATCTVDAKTQFGVTTLATITLTNPVTVAAADTVYVGVLTVGAATPPQCRGNQTNSAYNGNVALASGVRSGTFGAAQTSPPASVTLASMTAVASAAWAGLQ